MKKAAVGLLFGLLVGLWIGARVQSSILTDASPATDYHPNAVTYANAQPVPIPESLETEDTEIFRIFINAFNRELSRNNTADPEDNYRVYRTGILHIRRPNLIFQEVGEPAFYADSANLHRSGSARTFVLRLSEIRKKMTEAIETEQGIMDFQDLKKEVLIPYAEKEARLFARSRK